MSPPTLIPSQHDHGPIIPTSFLFAYLPDPNKETRIFDSSREGPAERILPHGFPHKLGSDMAWKRETISIDHPTGAETPYLLILQDPQLDEIEAALRHFERQLATVLLLFCPLKSD